MVIQNQNFAASTCWQPHIRKQAKQHAGAVPRMQLLTTTTTTLSFTAAYHRPAFHSCIYSCVARHLVAICSFFYSCASLPCGWGPPGLSYSTVLLTLCCMAQWLPQHLVTIYSSQSLSDAVSSWPCHVLTLFDPVLTCIVGASSLPYTFEQDMSRRHPCSKGSYYKRRMYYSTPCLQVSFKAWQQQGPQSEYLQ
jgi:hypothetical protein